MHSQCFNFAFRRRTLSSLFAHLWWKTLSSCPQFSPLHSNNFLIVPQHICPTMLLEMMQHSAIVFREIIRFLSSDLSIHRGIWLIMLLYNLNCREVWKGTYYFTLCLMHSVKWSCYVPYTVHMPSEFTHVFYTSSSQMVHGCCEWMGWDGCISLFSPKICNTLLLVIEKWTVILFPEFICGTL